MSKSFLTKETLNIFEKSRRARLEGRTGQYRDMKREAVRAVGWDKEAPVRGATCDQLTLDRPTLRSSRPPPRCVTVKAADSTTLTGESEIRARWAGYFEELYRADPPRS